jgi:alkanesulfonate monooxygenase SsuD/methylene tetrahydromethanopterin reductase-like flavin-dependent oxidoreductase (luciferase family)
MLPGMRVGLVLPIGERGDPPRATPYRDMRELAVLAEHSGLDSIWVADHFFYEPPSGPTRGLWESWTILAALADATRRVELGPLVLCTPFRNPALIAWMANTIDEVSGGRFVLGLGAGWHEPEFKAFGFEFERRVSLFEDSLEIVVPLLREGRVDYDGLLAGAHGELRPRGPRQSGPPVLISASKPRMMGLTAKWADRYNTCWYGLPTDEFHADVANLRRACADRGRDASEIEVNVGLQVVGELTADSAGGGAVSGSPEQIADALRAWREVGVAGSMRHMASATPQMVERVARGYDLLKAG